MNSPQYRQPTAPFTFPPTSTSSPPLSADPPETADQSSGPNERELRLINARKKLKNYRLKQAAANTSTNKTTSLVNLSPSAPATLSPLVATTSPSITRHKHTRTHSRNQSRSSLASILVSSEQVSLIDNALAHHRRLSLSKPPPSLPNSHLTPSEPISNRSSLPPPTPTFVSTPWAGNTEPHKRTHSHHVVHVRRESKHMRKNSVSTRRESIEIMGGLGIIGVPEPPRALNRGSWSGYPTRDDGISPPNSSNSTTNNSVTNQPSMETEVELARLAALDALEGKSSPESTEEIVEDTTQRPERVLSGADPSMSPASDGTSLQSITPKIAADVQSTFQRQPFSWIDRRPETVETDLEPFSPCPNTLSSRSERRRSWANGPATGLGLSSGSVVAGASGPAGLTWTGAGAAIGVARDLSRVEEEEEEEEDEDLTMVLSNALSQPRAMETVAEEEEEEEEDGRPPTSAKAPSPPKRRPHSLVFSVRGSTTPTNSPSLRSYPPSAAHPRGLSSSLSLLARPATAPLSMLKPLALTSPSFPETGSAFGFPSSHHKFNSSITSSSVTSSPVAGVKFDRAPPTTIGYHHHSAGSGSTTRSSLSGSIGSTHKPTAPTRSRSSISYSKSPSPEPVKGALTISTALARASQGGAEPSPTASASSRTSSQLEREAAHQTWKASMARSLQTGREGFGELVMMDEDEDWEEEEEGKEVLKAELVRAREETGRVRSESERTRAELEERVEEPQGRLGQSADGQKEPESEVVHRLREQVGELKRSVAELEAEKGELAEDVAGFKLRLKFLEGQMITEKAKSAQYERDLNEKAQMIEGLLGKRRGASVGSEEGADELKAAQVKLINEMRDQIFALAGALEKERSEHLATRDALEAAAMQIEVNELDEEDPNMATMFSDEDDSPVEGQVPFDCKLEEAQESIKAQPEPTLAAHSPRLETKPATTDCTRDSSVHSTDSEPLPKTPTIDQTRHHRSESFIRHWSFPKGPVTHSSRGSTEDDHCFFFRPNSIDISLPPVEPAKEVLEAPPFLFSYLHHEEPAEMDLQKEALSGYVSASAQVQKRPVPGGLVMMRRKEASGIRSPLSSTSSIHSSVGGRESASGVAKPGSRSLSTRLSLQNLSSWVGSYVGGGGGVSNEEKMSGQELRLSQLDRLRARIAKKSLGRLDFRHAFESEWDEDEDQLMEGDNRIFAI